MSIFRLLQMFPLLVVNINSKKRPRGPKPTKRKLVPVASYFFLNWVTLYFNSSQLILQEKTLSSLVKLKMIFSCEKFLLVIDGEVYRV